MAAATVNSYRKILNGIWRPQIGHLVFQKIRYSHLIAIADGLNWSKKTYNNSSRARLLRAQQLAQSHRP